MYIFKFQYSRTHALDTSDRPTWIY